MRSRFWPVRLRRQTSDTGGAICGRALLLMLLTMAAGFQFARLIGIFPHDGLNPKDKGQGPT